jgi:hypothetical protein
MLGKVKGECMAGVFTNGSKNGAFHFEQATDGQFEGVWAWQGSTQVGTWSGTRTSSSSPIDFKNFRRRPGDRHNQRIPNKRTDYDGDYGSTYGSLKLRHRDLFLIGDYGERGIFAAMWDGTSFVGKFTNGASTGWMDFAFFSPTAAFQSGEWGWDSGQPAAGSWNLNRQNNTTPDVDNMWKQMNCD